MSDDASPVKRGRKANTNSTPEKVEKVDNKKRARKEVKPAADSGDDEASPVKRGRGRPKGSTKKKAPAKPKAKSGTGRRGRPKKEEAKDSGDEDGEENDANEDEDD